MQSNYKIGDVISYYREGYKEPALGVVYQKLVNACFCKTTVPQYTHPIQVMVVDTDIIEIIKPN